jgi:hypothetical protein
LISAVTGRKDCLAWCETQWENCGRGSGHSSSKQQSEGINELEVTGVAQILTITFPSLSHDSFGARKRQTSATLPSSITTASSDLQQTTLCTVELTSFSNSKTKPGTPYLPP